MKQLPYLSAFVASLSLALLSSMSLDAKKPSFKNTKWVSVEEMFVADVGTGRDTTTLEFGPGKDIVIRRSWFLPAHPATYVNADGSVDMLPARSGEYSSKGTWRYRRGKLTVTLDDGSKEEFRYKDGKLIQAESSYELVVHDNVGKEDSPQ